MSVTDAFFESMSGITTTGATAISGLDDLPYGILMWRAMLHWLGGIGIIVMAVAILPVLRIGGMQLFRMESSDKTEKAMPASRRSPPRSAPSIWCSPWSARSPFGSPA